MFFMMMGGGAHFSLLLGFSYDDGWEGKNITKEERTTMEL